ncbi:MAG: aspartate kinase [Candidatus Woesearchaeota archaeon]
MLVMKFGGSSVKDANLFHQVKEIVTKKLNKKPVVVLSAVKGTTDLLFLAIDEALNGVFTSYNTICNNHKKIISDLEIDNNIIDDELKELRNVLDVICKTKDKSKQMFDYVSFFGERMCVKIFSALLNKENINAKSYVSGEIGMITNSNFGDARLLPESYDLLNKNILAMDHIPVITGFGGKDKLGEFTTFQRGGSDYVASLIGAAINAEAIEIWTDVNGILSTNPKIVPEARTIPLLTFDEASELAYFGAKVLHPKTILPAIKKNIPVYVLNTYEPDNPGSKIVSMTNDVSGVKGISYKKGIIVIYVKSTRMLDAYGFMAKIFEIFNKYHKPVDMISTSEVSVSITVDSPDFVDKICNDLTGIALTEVFINRAILYIVGQGMNKKLGVAGKMFSALGDHQINVEMISQCNDEVSIGCVVKEDDVEDAVKALHKTFIL